MYVRVDQGNALEGRLGECRRSHDGLSTKRGSSNCSATATKVVIARARTIARAASAHIRGIRYVVMAVTMPKPRPCEPANHSATVAPRTEAVAPVRSPLNRYGRLAGIAR